VLCCGLKERSVRTKDLGGGSRWVGGGNRGGEGVARVLQGHASRGGGGVEWGRWQEARVGGGGGGGGGAGGSSGA